MEQNRTAEHGTAQHGTAQHSMGSSCSLWTTCTFTHGMLPDETQHSMAQHSTAQHSMAQHGKAHLEAPVVGMPAGWGFNLADLYCVIRSRALCTCLPPPPSAPFHNHNHVPSPPSISRPPHAVPGGRGGGAAPPVCSALAVLLNLKHIFLYAAPAFFVFLLRCYCRWVAVLLPRAFLERHCGAACGVGYPLHSAMHNCWMCSSCTAAVHRPTWACASSCLPPPQSAHCQTPDPFLPALLPCLQGPAGGASLLLPGRRRRRGLRCIPGALCCGWTAVPGAA